MFNLTKGKLIRLNNDGSDGDIIQTRKAVLQIGSAPHHDYVVDDDDGSQPILFEISTDNLGRIKIKNLATDSLKVNNEAVSKERPLFSNSIIKINDATNFRWEYPKCESHELKCLDAEYASWSDPGRKARKDGGKTVRRIQSSRLTTHALHNLSSFDDESDTSFSISYNNSFKSFVDEQDAENRSIDGENVDGNATTASGQMSPKTPLKMNNMSTPLLTLSDEKSSHASSMSEHDENATPAQYLLELSHCTLTSYTPKTGTKSTIGNRSVAATPKSCYLTPTSVAFQTIENNDVSGLGKSPLSFCVVRPPTTPTTSNRNNISVHLIDLTTPETFHTPTASTAGTVIGHSRLLLKSAIKNSTQSALGGTPRRAAKTATPAISMGSGESVDGAAGPSSIKSAQKKTTAANVPSLATRYLITPRKIITTPQAPSKALLTPQTEKKVIEDRNANGLRSATIVTSCENAKKSTPLARKIFEQGTAEASSDIFMPDEGYSNENMEATGYSLPTTSNIALEDNNTQPTFLNTTIDNPSIKMDAAEQSVPMEDDVELLEEKGKVDMEDILLENQADDEESVLNIISEDALLAEPMVPIANTNTGVDENQSIHSENSGCVSHGDAVDNSESLVTVTEVIEEPCIQKHINYRHDCEVHAEEHTSADATNSNMDAGDTVESELSAVEADGNTTTVNEESNVHEDTYNVFANSIFEIDPSQLNVTDSFNQLARNCGADVSVVESVDQIDCSIANASMHFSQLMGENQQPDTMNVSKVQEDNSTTPVTQSAGTNDMHMFTEVIEEPCIQKHINYRHDCEVDAEEHTPADATNSNMDAGDTVESELSAGEADENTTAVNEGSNVHEDTYDVFTNSIFEIDPSQLNVTENFKQLARKCGADVSVVESVDQIDCSIANSSMHFSRIMGENQQPDMKNVSKAQDETTNASTEINEDDLEIPATQQSNAMEDNTIVKVDNMDMSFNDFSNDFVPIDETTHCVEDMDESLASLDEIPGTQCINEQDRSVNASVSGTSLGPDLDVSIGAEVHDITVAERSLHTEQSEGEQDTVPLDSGCEIQSELSEPSTMQSIEDRKSFANASHIDSSYINVAESPETSTPAVCDESYLNQFCDLPSHLKSIQSDLLAVRTSDVSENVSVSDNEQNQTRLAEDKNASSVDNTSIASSIGNASNDSFIYYESSFDEHSDANPTDIDAEIVRQLTELEDVDDKEETQPVVSFNVEDISDQSSDNKLGMMINHEPERAIDNSELTVPGKHSQEYNISDADVGETDSEIDTDLETALLQSPEQRDSESLDAHTEACDAEIPERSHREASPIVDNNSVVLNERVLSMAVEPLTPQKVLDEQYSEIDAAKTDDQLSKKSIVTRAATPKRPIQILLQTPQTLPRRNARSAIDVVNSALTPKRSVRASTSIYAVNRKNVDDSFTVVVEENISVAGNQIEMEETSSSDEPNVGVTTHANVANIAAIDSNAATPISPMTPKDWPRHNIQNANARVTPERSATLATMYAANTKDAEDSPAVPIIEENTTNAESEAIDIIQNEPLEQIGESYEVVEPAKAEQMNEPNESSISTSVATPVKPPPVRMPKTIPRRSSRSAIDVAHALLTPKRSARPSTSAYAANRKSIGATASEEKVESKTETSQDLRIDESIDSVEEIQQSAVDQSPRHNEEKLPTAKSKFLGLSQTPMKPRSVSVVDSPKRSGRAKSTINYAALITPARAKKTVETIPSVKYDEQQESDEFRQEATATTDVLSQNVSMLEDSTGEKIVPGYLEPLAAENIQEVFVVTSIEEETPIFSQAAEIIIERDEALFTNNLIANSTDSIESSAAVDSDGPSIEEAPIRGIEKTHKLAIPAKVKFLGQSQTPLKPLPVSVVDSPKRSGRAKSTINYAALITPTRKKKNVEAVLSAKEAEATTSAATGEDDSKSEKDAEAKIGSITDQIPEPNVIIEPMEGQSTATRIEEGAEISVAENIEAPSEKRVATASVVSTKLTDTEEIHIANEDALPNSLEGHETDLSLNNSMLNTVSDEQPEFSTEITVGNAELGADAEESITNTSLNDSSFIFVTEVPETPVQAAGDASFLVTQNIPSNLRAVQTAILESHDIENPSDVQSNGSASVAETNIVTEDYLVDVPPADPIESIVEVDIDVPSIEEAPILVIEKTPKLAIPVKVKFLGQSQTPLKSLPVSVVDSPKRSGRAKSTINYAALITPTRKKKNVEAVLSAKEAEATTSAATGGEDSKPGEDAEENIASGTNQIPELNVVIEPVEKQSTAIRIEEETEISVVENDEVPSETRVATPSVVSSKSIRSVQAALRTPQTLPRRNARSVINSANAAVTPKRSARASTSTYAEVRKNTEETKRTDTKEIHIVSEEALPDSLESHESDLSLNNSMLKTASDEQPEFSTEITVGNAELEADAEESTTNASLNESSFIFVTEVPETPVQAAGDASFMLTQTLPSNLRAVQTAILERHEIENPSDVQSNGAASAAETNVVTDTVASETSNISENVEKQIAPQDKKTIDDEIVTESGSEKNILAEAEEATPSEVIVSIEKSHTSSNDVETTEKVNRKATPYPQTFDPLSKRNLRDAVRTASPRSARQRIPSKYMDAIYVTPGKKTPAQKATIASEGRLKRKNATRNILQVEDDTLEATELAPTNAPADEEDEQNNVVEADEPRASISPASTAQLPSGSNIKTAEKSSEVAAEEEQKSVKITKPKQSKAKSHEKRTSTNAEMDIDMPEPKRSKSGTSDVEKEPQNKQAASKVETMAEKTQDVAAKKKPGQRVVRLASTDSDLSETKSTPREQPIAKRTKTDSESSVDVQHRTAPVMSRRARQQQPVTESISETISQRFTTRTAKLAKGRTKSESTVDVLTIMTPAQAESKRETKPRRAAVKAQTQSQTDSKESQEDVTDAEEQKNENKAETPKTVSRRAVTNKSNNMTDYTTDHSTTSEVSQSTNKRAKRRQTKKERNNTEMIAQTITIDDSDEEASEHARKRDGRVATKRGVKHLTTDEAETVANDAESGKKPVRGRKRAKSQDVKKNEETENEPKIHVKKSIEENMEIEEGMKSTSRSRRGRTVRETANKTDNEDEIIEESAMVAATPKAKGGRGKAKVEPNIEPKVENMDAEEDEPSTSTARRGRAAPRSAGNAKEICDIEEPEAISNASKTKGGRGKAKAKSNDNKNDDVVEVEEEKPATSRTRRGRAASAIGNIANTEDDEPEIVSATPKAKGGRGKAKVKSNNEQMDENMDADVDEPTTSTARRGRAAPKNAGYAKREYDIEDPKAVSNASKTTGGRGKAKAKSNEYKSDDVVDVEEKKPATSRTRRGRAVSAIINISSTEEDMELLDEPEVVAATPKPKGGRGRAKTKSNDKKTSGNEEAEKEEPSTSTIRRGRVASKSSGNAKKEHDVGESEAVATATKTKGGRNKSAAKSNDNKNDDVVEVEEEKPTTTRTRRGRVVSATVDNSNTEDDVETLDEPEMVAVIPKAKGGRGKAKSKSNDVQTNDNVKPEEEEFAQSKARRGRAALKPVVNTKENVDVEIPEERQATTSKAKGGRGKTKSKSNDKINEIAEEEAVKRAGRPRRGRIANSSNEDEPEKNNPAKRGRAGGKTIPEAIEEEEPKRKRSRTVSSSSAVEIDESKTSRAPAHAPAKIIEDPAEPAAARRTRRAAKK